MAIQIPQGYIVTAPEAIDNRLILTKAQMRELSRDENLGKLPIAYFCLCSDKEADGSYKMYIFNRYTPYNYDPNGTGRYTAYSANWADIFGKPLPGPGIDPVKFNDTAAPEIALNIGDYLGFNSEGALVLDPELINLIEELNEAVQKKQDKLVAKEGILLDNSEISVAFDKDTIILNGNGELSVNKVLFVTSEAFNEFKHDVEENFLRIDSELDELEADLDSEATIREAEDNELKAKLDSEAVIRAAADEALEDALDSEAAIREAEDLRLLALIDSEHRRAMGSEAWLDLIKQDNLIASEGIVLNGAVISAKLDNDTLKFNSEGEILVDLLATLPDGAGNEGKALILNSEGAVAWGEAGKVDGLDLIDGATTRVPVENKIIKLHLGDGLDFGSEGLEVDLEEVLPNMAGKNGKALTIDSEGNLSWSEAGKIDSIEVSDGTIIKVLPLVNKQITIRTDKGIGIATDGKIIHTNEIVAATIPATSIFIPKGVDAQGHITDGATGAANALREVRFLGKDSTSNTWVELESATISGQEVTKAVLKVAGYNPALVDKYRDATLKIDSTGLTVNLSGAEQKILATDTSEQFIIVNGNKLSLSPDLLRRLELVDFKKNVIDSEGINDPRFYPTIQLLNEQLGLKQDELTADYPIVITSEDRLQLLYDTDTLALKPATNKLYVKDVDMAVWGNLTDLLTPQTSEGNKLVDMDYLNSAISGNLGAFRGNFDSVSQLPTKAQVPDLAKNDYAFVTTAVVTSEGVQYFYNRYKFADTPAPGHWDFEYRVSGSTFTVNQLKAINSNWTNQLTDIAIDHFNDTVIHVTSADKVRWDGKQDTLTASKGIAIVSKDIQHTNTITAQTTKEAYKVTLDAQGHVNGTPEVYHPDWEVEDQTKSDFIKHRPAIKRGSGSSSLDPDRNTGVILNNVTVNVATGNYSVAEGNNTRATGESAHAEGTGTRAIGNYSHAEGARTTARGNYSHTEGFGTSTSEGAPYTHAEGDSTTASGYASHTEGISTTASNDGAHAEGLLSVASGANSHAEGGELEGGGTEASGQASHAEGINTIASGSASHAEGIGMNGDKTAAEGRGSHAEGISTIASGLGSHAEGNNTYAAASSAHAEGLWTAAIGTSSHAEGGALELPTVARGNQSHAEGLATTASGNQSHTEGNNTKAFAQASHAEGDHTTAKGAGSHTEGYYTLTSEGAQYAHAEGRETMASGEQSHAEGYKTMAYAQGSHTEGYMTTTSEGAIYSHAEGEYTTASGIASHAEGMTWERNGTTYYTTASNDGAHAEGRGTTASGRGAHAEGTGTVASGTQSHAEGVLNVASGASSHAEGQNTIASGSRSHAEGTSTQALGISAHAENQRTIAKGDRTHAEGNDTIATLGNQHVQGRANVEDTANRYADIVGWGEYNGVESLENLVKRKNISSLTTGGDLHLAGKVYMKSNDDGTGGIPVLPDVPTANGTYVLKVVVSGGVPTLQWVSE